MPLVKKLKRRLRRAFPPAPGTVYASWIEGSPYRPFNDEFACIFVHVPKAAGLAILTGLFGLEDRPAVRPGHRAAWEYRWHAPRRFASFFKFAFVRHPVDRFLSAFHFLQSGGINPADAAHAERFLAGHTAASFIDRLAEDPAFAAAALSYLHFRPQVSYLCGRSGKVLVDMVGRYESIELDYERVRQRLCCGGPLPRSNAGPERRDVLEERHRAVLRERYAADFQTFDYL